VSAQLTPTLLTLKGDKSLPRQLVLARYDSDLSSNLSAQAFAPIAFPDYRSIAFAMRAFKDCRLDAKTDHSTLWVGGSGFDVTAEEAAEILATFAGLKKGAP
jgi:hypothetical protein